MTIETKQWTGLVDRSHWTHGPWDDEPDKMQWQDDATGLACLANRGPLGNWCGYVGLPAGHSWRALPYDEIDVAVHGGLTFGPQKCTGNICHEVDGDDDVMWIGFDCAHYLDEVPFRRTWGDPNASYWTLEAVRAETGRLAQQVAEAMP